MYRYPSRFIFNTDKEYLDYTVELEAKLVDDSSKYIEASEHKMCMIETAFEVGDTVSHRVFGIGKIVDIRPDISSYVIKFEEHETERNLGFKAPLSRG